MKLYKIIIEKSIKRTNEISEVIRRYEDNLELLKLILNSLEAFSLTNKFSLRISNLEKI